MARAGSTVQYHLTAEIVERAGKGRRLGYFPPHELETFLSGYSPSQDIIVIKVHEYVDRVSELAERGRVKAVYVYRDIRDVVVSKRNQERRPFWRLALQLPEFLVQQYHCWTALPDVLVSKYETMYLNLEEEVLRIAEYLAIPLDSATAQDIARGHSIDAQRRRIEEFDYDQEGIIDSTGSVWNPETLLTIRHIHAARARQWESALSGLEVALIEAKTGDWLIARGYGVSRSAIHRLAAKVIYAPVQSAGGIGILKDLFNWTAKYQSPR